MSDGDITFSKHAVDRMALRGISADDVIAAILQGEVIQRDRTDTPWPSAIHLLWVTGLTGRRALHVITGLDVDGSTKVITAYWPDDRWDAEFRRRVK